MMDVEAHSFPVDFALEKVCSYAFHEKGSFAVCLVEANMWLGIHDRLFWPGSFTISIVSGASLGEGLQQVQKRGIALWSPAWTSDPVFSTHWFVGWEIVLWARQGVTTGISFCPCFPTHSTLSEFRLHPLAQNIKREPSPRESKCVDVWLENA